MASKKKVNETLGLLVCFVCGYPSAEVRRQSNGVLYYMCQCGKMTPSKHQGQEKIISTAHFFTAQELAEFNQRPANGAGLRVDVSELKIIREPETVQAKCTPEPPPPQAPPPPPDEKPAAQEAKPVNGKEPGTKEAKPVNVNEEDVPEWLQ